MLLWGDTQLVVEGVVPDLLHVVPVGHDSVLNGVLQGEDTSLGLGLVPHVRVLLAHAHHHALVAGTTHDRGEDGPVRRNVVQKRNVTNMSRDKKVRGDQKTYLGASSPAKPALHMPEPLSTTRAWTSSPILLERI